MVAKIVCAALLVLLTSGCATTRTLEDGPTDVPLSRRLAGGGVGLVTGALAGVGGAIALTGGEPEATLYVSAATVPACALIGLFSGLNRPAEYRSFARRPQRPAAGGELAPEIQSLVRTVAYEVRDRRSRARKK